MALVLGVRVGKLRQKSSPRNCPRKGDLRSLAQEKCSSPGLMATHAPCWWGRACSFPAVSVRRIRDPEILSLTHPGCWQEGALAKGLCVMEAGEVRVLQTLSPW